MTKQENILGTGQWWFYNHWHWGPVSPAGEGTKRTSSPAAWAETAGSSICTQVIGGHLIQQWWAQTRGRLWEDEFWKSCTPSQATCPAPNLNWDQHSGSSCGSTPHRFRLYIVNIFFVFVCRIKRITKVKIVFQQYSTFFSWLYQSLAQFSWKHITCSNTDESAE